MLCSSAHTHTTRDLERIKQIVLRAIIGLRGLWCYRPDNKRVLDQVLDARPDVDERLEYAFVFLIFKDLQFSITDTFQIRILPR